MHETTAEINPEQRGDLAASQPTSRAEPTGTRTARTSGASAARRAATSTSWILARPVDETPVQALVAVLCTAVDDDHSSPEQRELMLQLVHERPAVLAYQRVAVADHAEGQITAALAFRAGLPADDLGVRAVVSAVAACHHLAMTDWVRAGATGRFADAFLRTLEACALQFPDPTTWRR